MFLKYFFKKEWRGLMQASSAWSHLPHLCNPFCPTLSKMILMYNYLELGGKEQLHDHSHAGEGLDFLVSCSFWVSCMITLMLLASSVPACCLADGIQEGSNFSCPFPFWPTLLQPDTHMSVFLTLQMNLTTFLNHVGVYI